MLLLSRSCRSTTKSEKNEITMEESTMRIIIALMTVTLVLTGCAALENKAVAIGSGVDAFKVETTGSTSSGTFLPNLIAGGAVNTLATAPALQEGAQTQVVFAKSRRNSFFGELFGIDASTESVSYIGAPNETPEATAARFEAFAKVMKAQENIGK